MPRFFKDIVEESYNHALPTIEGQQVKREILEANAKVIEKLMSTDGSSARMPRISMKEALSAADASILFKKVINDILIRPVEPQMVASTRLAKIISVDNARSIYFPTIGAIRAAEISDNGDYPEAHPGFTEMVTELRVSKFGLVVPISEDVIADSQWDVVALFLEAARYAMARLKEERCFEEFSQSATRVFDNKYGAANAQTSGRGADGKAFNGTLSFRDVVDALGVLVSNEYVPTDITLHPMMWTVFAKDPVLQFLMLQNGQAAQSLSNMGADAIKTNLPWAFNVNVSPFVPYTVSDTISGFYTDGASTTGNITGIPTTEMFISDKNQSLVILQRDTLSVEEMDDPYRDIRRIKCKERYGVGTLNNGKGVVSIKNIVIGDNSEPVYTIKTVS